MPTRYSTISIKGVNISQINFLRDFFLFVCTVNHALSKVAGMNNFFYIKYVFITFYVMLFIWGMTIILLLA